MKYLVLVGLMMVVGCGLQDMSPASNGGGLDDDDVTDDDVADDDLSDDDIGDDDTTAGSLEGEFDLAEVDWTIHEIDVEVIINQDAELVIEYGVDQFDQQTPSQQVLANEPTLIRVKGLLADSSYQMRAVTGNLISESWQVNTDSAPGDYPEATVHLDESDLVQPGEVLCAALTPFHGDVYYCFNRDGAVVGTYFHPRGDSFRELRSLGNGLYGISSLPAEEIIIADGFTGEIVDQWYDFEFEEADEIRYHHGYLNDHEIIDLPDGSVAFMTWSREITDQSGTGLIVMDPNTGDVLYDWHILGLDLNDAQSGDPDMLDLNRFGLYQDGDWTHGNALVHWPRDGQDFFLMSLRTQDWVILINTQTDLVEWRLGREGDFELVDDLDSASPTAIADDYWFYQQHSPEITYQSGARTRILVYDNGYVRPEHENQGEYPAWYSRVVEYEIDESTMQAMVVNDYSDPDIGFFAAWYGDADRVPDGRTHFVDGIDAPFIGELDPGFDLTYRLSFQTLDYHEIYRVDWRPSIYEVDWRKISQE